MRGTCRRVMSDAYLCCFVPLLLYKFLDYPIGVWISSRRCRWLVTMSPVYGPCPRLVTYIRSIWGVFGWLVVVL